MFTIISIVSFSISSLFSYSIIKSLDYKTLDIAYYNINLTFFVLLPTITIVFIPIFNLFRKNEKMCLFLLWIFGVKVLLLRIVIITLVSSNFNIQKHNNILGFITALCMFLFHIFVNTFILLLNC